MQGQKGASHASTRKIYRRIQKSRNQLAEVQRVKATRPGYNPETCLTAETIRVCDRWLSGERVPVGCLVETWRAVCQEFASKGVQ